MRKDPLAILFDLDGTLCIREATRRRYADLFLAAFGGVLESDDPELVAAALAKADGDGYNASRFSDLAADPLWAERPCVEDLARHWDHHFPTCAVCIPEVPLALERLQSRGLHLGVVTNGVETKQRRKLEAMGIADIFGTVVISGRFGVLSLIPGSSRPPRLTSESALLTAGSWGITRTRTLPGPLPLEWRPSGLERGGPGPPGFQFQTRP